MSVGGRIKACRQKAKLSQEKVAELVGVSRQAVTKWEADQSAPSTENLFKLAEIFSTTVDMLLDPGEEPGQSPIEQAYQLIKREEEKRITLQRSRRKRNILAAISTAAVYLLIYLSGRILWCDFSDSSFIGWLVLVSPSGSGSYLYGWLLSSNLFWLAMIISVIPTLFGKYKFSLTTVAAFIVGLVTGMLFGPYPAGIPYGHGHYGWAIWGAIYLLSVAAGILLERFIKRKN